MLTGSSDHTARKWDINTYECVHIFKGHSSNVLRVICYKTFVFTCSFDQTARCWNFNTGECLQEFKGHKRGVYHLIFIPGNRNDVSVTECDNDDGSLKKSSEKNGDSVKSDDRKLGILLTGSADSTAKAFSLVTGECLTTFREHQGVINCMLTDAPGKVLYTGAADGTVRSWNINTGGIINRFEGHHAAVICMIVSC